MGFLLKSVKQFKGNKTDISQPILLRYIWKENRKYY